MEADVFLEIILASTLVLTIGTAEALSVVRFGLMAHEAYSVLVLPRTQLAPVVSVLLFSFGIGQKCELGKLLEQWQLIVGDINDFLLNV